ncbi:hypothetical protein DSO57_1027823 [Entomophthora muscae]|uniref:Uncharacterized protein n=1 Tax=Entomophthora muscae TaxID=34485 RepID=A0ACC2UM72_9FUNG|nr:hypothetical protein DSO57_1027823 [Entomophthora muscae]
MPAPSNYQCIWTSSNLYYAQGNVDAHSTGLLDVMQPIQLAKNTYWRPNTSSKDHLPSHLKLSIKSPKFNREIILRIFKPFYYWEGGILVSDPITCYEHERCTATVTWDGMRWTSKTSKEWITPTYFQNTFQETHSYVHTGNGIEYTHTFDGPKIQTIYFNRMSLIIRAQQFEHFNVFGFPMYFWLNCSKSFPMDGVFGIASKYFVEI